MIRFYFLTIILFAANANAQKLKKEDKLLLSNLQMHVKFLSSDQLEGRRTGTKGEELAAAYISSIFRSIGLQPKGTNDFLQPFEIPEGNVIHPSTHLIINENELKLEKDFFPLVFGANASIAAMSAPSLQEENSPWFIDVKDILEENATNPHFDLNEAIKNKAVSSNKKGATALFVYNSSEKQDGLAFNRKEKTGAVPIPVIYIKKDAAAKLFADESASLDIKLKSEIVPAKRSGKNVVGYLDNGAPTTIVLGAHYDHLGFGEDGNSMHRTSTKEIHNGADDNASGIATMMELARLLKASKNKNHNYLFIAFSGEELGLFGSKYFVENPTIDLKNINFMINMDMLGRLNDSTSTITVGGYGTSPAWGQLYAMKGKKKLFADNLVYKFDSSGTGPSDHTSFYRKDIPVLFYFTGLHTDYHKPSDDYDKINFTGQMKIVKHIYSLIESVNQSPAKIAFTKTREVQMGTAARFSVTLGIMPDYTFPGTGVRLDGVSENRPAQKAGMKAGDIVTSIGEYKISSVESYMQALSKFKKGDKTTVTYKRGEQETTVDIEF